MASISLSSTLHQQLSRATLSGDTQKMQKAIDSGASVNQQTSNGFTMLHFAISKGHVKAVELLILEGADASLKEEKGTSALDFAKKLGHKEIVQIIEAAAETKEKVKTVSRAVSEALWSTVPKSQPTNPHTKESNWATPFGRTGNHERDVLSRIMAQYALSTEKEEPQKNSSCVIS